MEPTPDQRWESICGGVTPYGLVLPVSFQVLRELADEWAQLIPPQFDEDHGPIALLRMARSLFAHAWFDYEFMVVACLIGLQAMEAAFHVLYPDANEKVPFRALVRRAREDGTLTPSLADIAEAGVDLRNVFSHPATQAALSVGAAGGLLEPTHRMVALIMTKAFQK